MIIRAYNPSLESLESTTLSQYTNAAATTLTVLGNQGFANTDPILIGEMGTNNAEIRAVNAAVTAGTSLTVTSTIWPHNADEPVIRLRYNQVKFYRSTTTATGSYTLLATVGMDVDNPDLQTTYDDTTGTAAYFYKISYYNSVSTTESSLSDPVVGAGYVRNSVGSLIDEVAREVNDENFRIASRNQYIAWMNEVNDDLITRARRPFAFLRQVTTLGTTAAQNYITLPTDFWKFDRFEYTWTIGNIGRIKELYPKAYEIFRQIAFNPNALGNDDLQFISLNDTQSRMMLYPKPLSTQASAITFWYYRTFNELDSEGDVFELPNPLVYKKYLLGQLFLMKGSNDATFLQISDRYLSEYNAQVNKLQRINNKDVGSPRGIRGETRRQKGYRGSL